MTRAIRTALHIALPSLVGAACVYVIATGITSMSAQRQQAAAEFSNAPAIEIVDARVDDSLAAFPEGPPIPGQTVLYDFELRNATTYDLLTEITAAPTGPLMQQAAIRVFDVTDEESPAVIFDGTAGPDDEVRFSANLGAEDMRFSVHVTAPSAALIQPSDSYNFPVTATSIIAP